MRTISYQIPAATLPTFGMTIEARTWSSQDYRFGFNGQEKDDEIYGAGNSTSAEYWQYDSRLGRRWNVDPKTRAFESGYACFSNSPLVKIDPLGNSDYYTAEGEYLGSDGTEGTSIIVVTAPKTIKEIRNATKEALKTQDYAEYLGKLKDGTYFEIPSYEDRQKIKAIMSTQHEDENYEVGGRGFTLQTVDDGKITDEKNLMLQSINGENPKNPNDIPEIDLSKFDINSEDAKAYMADNVDKHILNYTWHSHPDHSFINIGVGGNDNWVLLVSQSATSTQRTLGGKDVNTQGGGPSEADFGNAKEAKSNYIMSLSNKAVYFYNKDHVEVKMKDTLFYDTKAKTKPDPPPTPPQPPPPNTK